MSVKKIKEAASSTKAAEHETVMYIGPTIIGVVKQYAVYKNGVPQHIVKLTEKLPALKHLLIPIDSITIARKQLKEAGSALNVMYNKVLSYIKGGK